MKDSQKLTTIFNEITDPRRDLGKYHKLNDILLIGIIAVLCGAETWNNIEAYARSKESFLRKFLELPNGIPSHDTINRVFQSLIVKSLNLVLLNGLNPYQN